MTEKTNEVLKLEDHKITISQENEKTLGKYQLYLVPAYLLHQDENIRTQFNDAMHESFASAQMNADPLGAQEESPSMVYVMMDDEKLVGTATMKPMKMTVKGEESFVVDLASIAVPEEYRDKKVATELVKQAHTTGINALIDHMTIHEYPEEERNWKKSMKEAAKEIQKTPVIYSQTVSETGYYDENGVLITDRSKHEGKEFFRVGKKLRAMIAREAIAAGFDVTHPLSEFYTQPISFAVVFIDKQGPVVVLDSHPAKSDNQTINIGTEANPNNVKVPVRLMECDNTIIFLTEEKAEEFYDVLLEELKTQGIDHLFEFKNKQPDFFGTSAEDEDHIETIAKINVAMYAAARKLNIDVLETHDPIETRMVAVKA